jgi:Tol biopolymer transport system component
VADVAWAGADWDPAGKGLAVLRSGAGGPVTLEFPVNRRLLEGRLDGVRFSRDGSRLAVFSEGSEGSSLVVLDREGKNRREVSSGWFAVSGLPNWHPNGEIWFTARKSGDDDSLWAATLSERARQVMRVPGTLELYDIAPDGRVLIGHHTQIRTIRGVSASDGSEGELSWLDNSLPSDLSADGTTLLITEIGAGAGEGPAFYTRKTDRTPATRISDGWGLALSEDKKWVLANRREGKKWRFWLVPTGTGDGRPLEAGFDVSAGAFVPGTSRIVFSADDSDARSRLYTLDTSGGKAVPIPGGEEASISLFSSPVSPDGKRLLASRRGGVVVLPLGGGDARPIPGPSLPGFRVPQWSADSTSVYVFTPTGHSLDVELVNVDSGARRPWKQIPVASDDWKQFRLRITPDGRVWAYSSAMNTSELYVVEGLR